MGSCTISEQTTIASQTDIGYPPNSTPDQSKATCKNDRSTSRVDIFIVEASSAGGLDVVATVQEETYNPHRPVSSKFKEVVAKKTSRSGSG